MGAGDKCIRVKNEKTIQIVDDTCIIGKSTDDIDDVFLLDLC